MDCILLVANNVLISFQQVAEFLNLNPPFEAISYFSIGPKASCIVFENFESFLPSRMDSFLKDVWCLLFLRKYHLSLINSTVLVFLSWPLCPQIHLGF